MKLAPALALAFALVVSTCVGAWTALQITGHAAAANEASDAGWGIGIILVIAIFFAWLLED